MVIWQHVITALAAAINNKTSSCFYANLWTVHHIKELRDYLHPIICPLVSSRSVLHIWGLPMAAFKFKTIVVMY